MLHFRDFFATSPSSWPFSSSELARDLSVKLELTLSRDRRVINSSLVEALIGRAVRIDVKELLVDDGLYLLLLDEGEVLGVPVGWRYGWCVDGRPFAVISRSLLDEGGKYESCFADTRRTDTAGLDGSISEILSLSGDVDV